MYNTSSKITKIKSWITMDITIIIYSIVYFSKTLFRIHLPERGQNLVNKTEKTYNCLFTENTKF